MIFPHARKPARMGKKEILKKKGSDKMKHMRKLFAVLLAVMLVMGLATTAFAANDTPHTITIDNTTAGYTYEAYRVFEGTLNTDGELQELNWSDGVNATTLLTALNRIDAFKDCSTAVDVATVLGGITAANDSVTQAFADAVAANLADKAGEAKTVTSGKGYVINVTGDGYYFVKTTAVPSATETTAAGVHTRYILKVVGNVEVTHKGTVPSVEKKIVEGNNDVDSTDVNIGDPVTFKLEATLPSDYTLFKTYTVTFHDTMSDNLTLDENSFVVKVDGTAIESTKYQVITSPEDGHDIDVVIADVKATAAKDNSKITVTYDAKLKADM